MCRDKNKKYKHHTIHVLKDWTLEKSSAETYLSIQSSYFMRSSSLVTNLWIFRGLRASKGLNPKSKVIELVFLKDLKSKLKSFESYSLELSSLRFLCLISTSIGGHSIDFFLSMLSDLKRRIFMLYFMSQREIALSIRLV